MYDTSGIFAGSYLCLGGAAGGVKFNEASKKWLPAMFKTEDDKFVVSVKADKVATVTVFGSPTQAMGYNISIRPLGAPQSICIENDGFRESLLEPPRMLNVYPTGRVRCSANLTDYEFNFHDLRFLSIYAVGFVDGTDDPANTPFVETGTCSRID